MFRSMLSPIRKKTDRAKWTDNATGGILGYPAVVVLLSIIDCLGSVFDGDNTFTISIDGKEQIHQKCQPTYLYTQQ